MTEKRKPQKTPGEAKVSFPENDDFTLPGSLYYDAIYFCNQAKVAEEKKDIRGKERYARAAIFCASSFLEATLNQAAFGHAHAHSDRLGQIEKDVLEECEITIDPKGDVLRKQKFYPFESRFCFIVQFLSGKSFDKGGQLWQQFMNSKKLRDTWTHPKPPFDTDGLTISNVKLAINANREALIELSNLMGIDPPPWLSWTFDEIVDDIEKKQNQS